MQMCKYWQNGNATLAYCQPELVEGGFKLLRRLRHAEANKKLFKKNQVFIFFAIITMRCDLFTS